MMDFPAASHHRSHDLNISRLSCLMTGIVMDPVCQLKHSSCVLATLLPGQLYLWA